MKILHKKKIYHSIQESEASTSKWIKLTDIHGILKFKQSPWLKAYVKLNSISELNKLM